MLVEEFLLQILPNVSIHVIMKKIMLNKNKVAIKQLGICPETESIITRTARLLSIPILIIRKEDIIINPTTIKKLINISFHPNFGHFK